MERILARTVTSNIHLALDVSPEGPFVRIDPGLFDQVLLNLVVNARDAMPNGGEIRIQASTLAGGQARIEVCDSGVGMTSEQVRRAVEPFYTTKAQGTGLGLAMCYGIIERAGGSLSLDSVPGQGTTVCIELPGAEGPDLEPAAPLKKDLPALAGLRILLVEDMPSLRRLLRRVLQRAGVTVVEAGDGKQGYQDLKFIRILFWESLAFECGSMGDELESVLNEHPAASKSTVECVSQPCENPCKRNAYRADGIAIYYRRPMFQVI